MIMSARLLLTGSLALLATHCVPGARFDNLSENAPVVVIPRSDGMTTFGFSLATASRGAEAELAVGGAQFASPVAVYRLGGSDQPSTTATSDGFCGGANCVLAKQFAGRGVARLASEGELAEQKFCYTMGAGETSQAEFPGLLTRCSGDKVHPLPVPEEAKAIVDALLLGDTQDLVIVTSNHLSDQPLLVGAKSSPLAWYYHPNSTAGKALPTPGGVTGFGETLAVLVNGDQGSILAIGSPAKDEVRFYAAPYDKPAEGVDPTTVEQADPTYLGCISGGTRFGETMAAGDIDGDGIEELAIADDTVVTVFSGAGFAALDGEGKDPQGCGDTLAPLATLECGSDPALDVGSCGGGDFGAAIAIGDFDGDGDGEVAIGVPGMKVRGIGGAGTVLVFDVEGQGEALDRLTSTLFLSSGEKGDELGSSLAAPRLGSRHVIAAGAPRGDGKVALFYCPALSGKSGFSRCN